MLNKENTSFYFNNNSFIENEKSFEFEIEVIQDFRNLSMIEKIKVFVDKQTNKMNLKNIYTGFSKTKTLTAEMIRKIKYNIDNPLKVLAPILFAFLTLSATEAYSNDTIYTNYNKAVFDIINDNKNPVKFEGPIEYNDKNEFYSFMQNMNSASLRIIDKIINKQIKIAPEKEKEIRDLFTKKTDIQFKFNRFLVPSATIAIDNNKNIEDRRLILEFVINEVDIEKLIDDFDDIEDFLGEVSLHESFHGIGVLYSNWEKLFPEYIAIKGQQLLSEDSIDEDFLEEYTKNLNSDIFVSSVENNTNKIKAMIESNKDITPEIKNVIFTSIDKTREFFDKDINENFEDYKKAFYSIYNTREIDKNYSLFEYSDAHLLDINKSKNMKNIIEEYLKSGMDLNLANPANSVSNTLSYKIVENMKSLNISEDLLKASVIALGNCFESKKENNRSISLLTTNFLKVAFDNPNLNIVYKAEQKENKENKEIKQKLSFNNL